MAFDFKKEYKEFNNERKVSEGKQMDIEQINMDEWVRFGEGRQGESYYHVTDEDLMLKLYSAHTPFEEIKGEFDKGFVASSLNLPVPQCYKMVASGERYGIVFQRVQDKISMARAIADDPSRIEECAAYMADTLRLIHATQADTTVMPSIGELFSPIVETCNYLSDAQRKRLLGFLKDVEGPTTCLHGDFHMGNVIMARGKLYTIDLNMFSYGDPHFDEASFCYISAISAVKNPTSAFEVYHMPLESITELWRTFCRLYAGVTTDAQREEYEHMLLPYIQVDVIRKAVGLNYLPSVVAISQELLERS